jgi:hypothetical protein
MAWLRIDFMSAGRCKERMSNNCIRANENVFLWRFIDSYVVCYEEIVRDDLLGTWFKVVSRYLAGWVWGETVEISQYPAYEMRYESKTPNYETGVLSTN